VYLYRRRLENKLHIKERDAEAEYVHIKTCIRETAEEALDLYRKNQKPSC
jgi:hypothetical protein